MTETILKVSIWMPVDSSEKSKLNYDSLYLSGPLVRGFTNSNACKILCYAVVMQHKDGWYGEKKFLKCIIFNFNICRYVLDMSVVQNVDGMFTCLVTLAILIQACS